jgi:hypothetical protein
MDTERGKAAYEHYRRQVESLDRDGLIELALRGVFDTLGEHGGGADLDAASYYFDHVPEAKKEYPLVDFPE